MSCTPLGRPVVPPVPTSITRSSGGVVGPVGTGDAPSGLVPASAVESSSRQTSVLSFGRSRDLGDSPRSCRGRAAPAVEESSSSRFSSASLRGLIGHQTAPAARSRTRTRTPRVVGRQDRDLVRRAGRPTAPAPPATRGTGPARRRRTAVRRRGSGRARPAERRALVQIVDQRGHRPWLVVDGRRRVQHQARSCAARPAAPDARTPGRRTRARPARGGCCSSE